MEQFNCSHFYQKRNFLSTFETRLVTVAFLHLCSAIVVLSWPILREFSKQHPDAANALKDWYQQVSLADWRTLADVRQFSNSVDYVGNFRYVFNIRGNRYRLIAAIVFSTRTVFVKFVGTHQEYDEVDATTINYSKP